MSVIQQTNNQNSLSKLEASKSTSSKRDFLLELFSEEIPAKMQKGAEEGYNRIFTDYFQQNEIKIDDLSVYISPRRITILARGLPLKVPAKLFELKGPCIDAPEKALEGFCRSNSVSKEDLDIKDVKGKQFYFLIKKLPERNVAEIIAKTICEPIAAYVWPKSMYWGDYKIKWVRPLHNILCIFDDEVVPFQYGHLNSNNQTFGHRFMSPDAIYVDSVSDYLAKLKAANVILDSNKRLEIISEQINKELASHSLQLKKDDALLEEIVGLVEYPKVLLGKINDEFLQLPAEVLVTSMRVHQKYFSTIDSNGNFAPYFVFVTNIISSNEQIIISGNEKVLSARLSDALHFYNQDLKISLDTRAAQLDNVVFHEKLGSLGDKSNRLEKLCQHIDAKDNDAQIASRICKSDIVSEMVGEFANLQGIMGYYYAIESGYNDRVAKSIRDHYKPTGENDRSIIEGSPVLALSDKIDTLVGLMLAGERPTGSKDPYALRRIAIGIIRNITENNLRINLFDLINFAINLFDIPQNHHRATAEEILLFIEERAKHYYKNQENQSYIAAALDLISNSDIKMFEVKLRELEKFMQSSHSESLFNSYKRAANITAKGKDRDNKSASLLSSGLLIKEELFATEYESELNEKTDSTLTSIRASLEDENFGAAFNALQVLVLPLNQFFENVMVNDDDAAIATNRIALLAKVRYAFNLIVNFDKL